MWIVSVDCEGSASHHTAAVNKASLVEYVQVDMKSETETTPLVTGRGQDAPNNPIWLAEAERQLSVGLNE